jgi:hypothetical protein
MDISTNSDLQWLICDNNLLTGLDISMNPSLGVLECQNNSLTSLNVKNGNNSNISGSDFDATNNPDLTCIQVDDVAYSTTNWTNKDAAASYNTNCTPTLQYTAGANGTISGTTSQTVNYGADGSPVTAVPNTGYHFVNWSDGSTQNPRTDLNVVANINVTANFDINTYIISAIESPAISGTISGTGTYNYGDNITLTASAETGFVFSNWTENGSPVSSNSSYSFTVNANRTFVANFSASSTQYTISASVSPINSGTITGAGNYNQGDNVSLKATANTGYTFVYWTESGTQVSTDTSYSFTATANRTFVANFAIRTYSVSYMANANGAISGTANQTVNYGANGTAVTAVPNTGYHFVNWSDGSTTNPRTDLNVTASINVTANFAINTFTLDYTAGTNGSITGTASQTVNYGANGSQVTAVPNTGYHFVNWSDGSTANPRTDLNVTANIAVSANFAINTFTLAYAAGANGTITGIASQTVNYGANGSQVTAVPNTGYHFVNWSDGSTTNPRTDSNITANINVSANFAINQYTISANVSPINSGTTTGSGNYNHGENVTLTATANAGYRFINWIENNTPVSTDTAYSFTASANRVLIANFELISGIGISIKSNSISAYPNPTTENLTLKVKDFELSTLYFQLFDMQGKLLETKKLVGNETNIETSNLAPAIYFLKVKDGDKELKMFKIIKN